MIPDRRRVARSVRERTKKPAIEVWTDGDCRFCQGSRCWVEQRDVNSRLKFRDFRSADDEALPTRREELESAMWVRRPDGSAVGGFPAWLEVMAQLPRWRLVTRVLRLPPLSWLGALVYRLVARYRFLIAGRS